MPRLWYREGLQFECTQCGNCCTGDPGYVWVTPEEIKATADFLEMPHSEFRRKYVRKAKGRFSLVERANGDCVFYQEGCSIYPVRPSQCRTFPFWRNILQRSSDWDAEAEDCPGMNHGKFYSLDEIRQIQRGEKDT